MANDPIYTDIINNTEESYLFHYAEKGAVWLAANSTTRVPYELWSAASETNRSGLLAAVVAGRITLKVGILNDNDEYVVVDFAPHKAFGFEVTPPEDEKAKVGFNENTVKGIRKAEYREDDATVVLDKDDSHIVKAGSENSKTVAEYIGAKAAEEAKIPAQSEVVNGEPMAVEKAELGDEQDPWSKYEQAVADKKWSEAADILSGVGAEGVTARSLMALKDKSVDAVKAKYKLA